MKYRKTLTKHQTRTDGPHVSVIRKSPYGWSQHHHALKTTRRTADYTVELIVDEEKLIRRLAERAISSKGGQSRAMSGIVRLRVVAIEKLTEEVTDNPIPEGCVPDSQELRDQYSEEARQARGGLGIGSLLRTKT